MLRRLLVAAVILGALGAGVWWSNKKTEEAAAKPKADDPSTPQLLSIPDGDLTEIRLKRGEAAVLLKKSPAGKWEMIEPKGYRADADVVGAILGAIAPLNATQVIDEKPASMASFGLQSPGAEAAFVTKDGKTRTVYLGDDVPASGDIYARLEGDPKVYSVANSVKSALDKSADDLRDKRLMTFDAAKLTRLELSSKGQAIEFGKNARGDWAILKPKAYRADGLQVEELIRKLKEAKLDASGEPDTAKRFQSATQVALARATDQSGTQTFEVRKSKDEYYAKASATGGVYKVAADVGQGLTKTLDDFRNKKLFDFGFSDVNKLEVMREAKTLTYAKAGEKWYAGPKEIDSSSLQNVIDKLRELAATKFGDKMSGTPLAAFAVTAKDGKIADRVSVVKEGNDYLARRDSEPEVYQLDTKAVEELLKSAAEVKDAGAGNKK